MPLGLLQPLTPLRHWGARLRLTLAATLLYSLTLALPTRALADSSPTWFAEPYPYVLVEQDVRKAMDAFGQQLHLSVVFSDRVRGLSKSPIRATRAGEFLENLCATNGLAWYFDGSALYLYGNDELATRPFRPLNSTAAELRQYLAELPVAGQGLGVREGSTEGELLVSGPPAYLERVQSHLAQARRPPARTPEPPTRGVRVYRGNTLSQAQ